MSAAAHLASFGFTVAQANAWIMSNLNDPATIFNTCKQFGVNSEMLAEIVETSVPGVTAGMVEGFFSAKGFSGGELNAAVLSSGDDTSEEAVEEETADDSMDEGIPAGFESYIGSYQMGYDDGYHDNYLEAFFSFFGLSFNGADGSDTAEYMAGYQSGASAGYSAGASQDDYTAYYAGEDPAFTPDGSFTLAQMGAASGYLDGYLDGIVRWIQNSDPMFDTDINMYSLDAGPADYQAGYNSGYQSGLADGTATNEFDMTIPSMEQSVAQYGDIFF